MPGSTGRNGPAGGGVSPGGAPPANPAVGNSANHGGTGQNVLFLDGSVRFCPTRTVGLSGDDIYLNRVGRQAAGLDAADTVLGSSASSP